MRFARAAGLTVLVAIAALAFGFTGEDAADRCAGRLWCTDIRLPAPILITDGRLTDRIARDGRATRVPPPARPYPREATWFPGTNTWFEIRHPDLVVRRGRARVVGRGRGERGYLVVGRGRTSLWRSREQFAANQLGLIAAGPNAVAFQHDHRLYIAPDGGAERPIAPRELPLGWTKGGLYTYSYPRQELLLRGDTGALLKTIGGRPTEYQFDLADGRLYFLRDGVLMGARGACIWRLASLRSLGMSANTWLQPLGGLVELLNDRRLVVVRPDGSLFASTAVRNLDRISSFLAIAPHASAVAFTGVTGPTRDPNAETVYLLREGAHAALAVHREPGSFGGCAQGASVQWHGSWLLYSDSGGQLAAADTAGTHRTIELSGLARRLLGVREGLDAHWSR